MEQTHHDENYPGIDFIDSHLEMMLSPQQQQEQKQHNEQFSIILEKDKKKAQNRAAQKAFRERKIARMKELQDSLNASEQIRLNLLHEIEQLKLLNTEINTENQFLRKQTESNTYQGLSPPTSINDDLGQLIEPKSFSFPTKETFFKTLMLDQFGETFISEKFPEDLTYPGIQLLSVPATWEYLQKIIQRDDIEFDMTMVMNNLKRNHVCTEEGPSYPIYLINQMIVQAIEQSP
ncbi:hypothetical protein C6P45_002641 [Maudiozyma exigua]|uniref:BZIP domain-containing protein n=1 Tax=Maudiozyma exigua TaxID=34358 RepID=A0A9P7B3Q4_MAUEX|nr:hypothetical protein C6P45_002641 [Kazachstania exigua]